MSLDLMQLMCDVKYITWDYVIMGYAHVSVIDVRQEMKISNTFNGLVLSQSYEKCDDSLVSTPYAKSICIFGKSINLNRHALLDTCASYLYILLRAQSYDGSWHIRQRRKTMRQLLSNGSISKL